MENKKKNNDRIVQVSPSLNIFASLAYRYSGDPEQLKPGLRVVVPVGNRLTTGWIVDTDSSFLGRVKNITAVVKDNYCPSPRFLDFIAKISHLYFTSAGILLDSSLPPARKTIQSLYITGQENGGKIKKLSSFSLVELEKKNKESGGPVTCFYKGNDSEIWPCPGATPVNPPMKNLFIMGDYQEREGDYVSMICSCLKEGKSVIFVVPDNLTAAFVKERLSTLVTGGDITVYNSDLKPKERDRLWKDWVAEGKAGVIIGGQSALLLPVPLLGMVICDRAGSPKYARTYFSPYNVAVMAQTRAQCEGVPLVEGFPTLTLRSYRHQLDIIVQNRRLKGVEAEVQAIKPNTRGNPAELDECLERLAGEKKKILVVLNKKESDRFFYCHHCKTIQRCRFCHRPLNVAEDLSVSCGHCSFGQITANECSKCKEPLELVDNISVASVKKRIHERVTESGVTTLSSEGLKQDFLFSILKRLGESDIVVATPVIINPMFNRLFDAVIYVRPESLFNLDDYDAAEKIFTMVAELGELVKPGGSLLVFSTFHFHYSLKLINHEADFYQREMNYREWFHLPPFAHVYHLEIKAKELRQLGKEMRDIYQTFKQGLTIKRIYLPGRQPVRGFYKGTMEIHTLPPAISASGLLNRRDISIELVMV